MPDEYRVTIRLTPELHAQLEAHGSHGQPLAAIVRDALIVYLARQPDPPPQGADTPETMAAMAASLADLQRQVQELTIRVDALAAIRQPPAASEPPQSRQPAAATAASAVQAPAPPRAGRPRSALGQRILTLLGAHPEGLSAEQIRVYVSPERPIGDILSGMRRTKAVHVVGEGRKLRYVLAEGHEST